jgi:hypothetical protein
MNESIPSVLNYQTSQALFRTNEFNCFPQEGQTAGTNGRFTVRLPQKSIINLSSIRACFNHTVTGLLDGATDFRNALASVPVHTLFKSIQWRVAGTTVAGAGSVHYNQIYHALCRASVSVEGAQSKVDSGYQALALAIDDPIEALGNLPLKARPGALVGNTKSARLVMSDLLGLSRSGSEAYLDTSLFGDVELIFEVAGTESMYVSLGGAAAVNGCAFTLSDFQVNVKCITSISPLYVEMLANRLESKVPIRWPYENYTSTVVSNNRGATLSINTGCLDKVLIVPFSADPDTLVSIVADSINPNKFRFNSGLTKANSNTFRLQTKINNEYYPKSQIQNLVDCASITTEAIFGSGDMSAQNMLFLDYLDASASSVFRSRDAYLSENCVIMQKFCLQEGWAGAKQATGISSNGSQMNIDVSYVLPSGSLVLLAAFYTSYLIYNPATGSTEIEA